MTIEGPGIPSSWPDVCDIASPGVCPGAACTAAVVVVVDTRGFVVAVVLPPDPAAPLPDADDPAPPAPAPPDAAPAPAAAPAGVVVATGLTAAPPPATGVVVIVGAATRLHLRR